MLRSLRWGFHHFLLGLWYSSSHWPPCLVFTLCYPPSTLLPKWPFSYTNPILAFVSTGHLFLPPGWHSGDTSKFDLCLPLSSFILRMSPYVLCASAIINDLHFLCPGAENAFCLANSSFQMQLHCNLLLEVFPISTSYESSSEALIATKCIPHWQHIFTLLQEWIWFPQTLACTWPSTLLTSTKWVSPFLEIIKSSRF